MTDLPPMPPHDPENHDNGDVFGCEKTYFYTADQMREYALAAIALEREACAKVCEQTDEDGEGPDCWGWHAKDYARAIRARK